MASSYTQIYQYRDPQQLSIANTLGKASTFKQEEYNINTSAMQQLVNQYVGTDLLRGIDQEYLGNRLQTLTNYVNQAGTMDWSRKAVFNDVSNYVGQALDSNVMAGIASTKTFRMHQAQMEDLKKNKPELYAVQNDWMSTRDLQRYMSSNQLGDNYRQGSYVPYTDVKKELLENSKYLKDFGVEAYIDSSDSNIYFKTIKTGEKITKDKANQYVDLVLGEKGKTQLMIDGIYNYKDIPTDQLKKEYSNHVNDISNNYSKSAKALRLAAANSPKNQQAQLLSEADIMDEMANQTTASKGLLTDRDSISSNLYLNKFKQKWSDMLSYDRIKDWKIDDSGLQIAKFNQQVKQDTLANNFKLADLEIDKQKLSIEQNKLAVDLMKAGLKMDAKGNIIEDSSSNRNPLNQAGITATQSAKNLEELEITPVRQIFSDYNTAYGAAITGGTTDISNKLNNPQYSQLKKELNFEGRDAKYIINSMILNPNGYNKLLNILDPNTKDLIRKAQGAYKEKESIKQKAEPIFKDVERISNGIYNSPDTSNSFKNNVNLFQGGYSIDNKGNLTKKDVRRSNDLNDRKVREIGVINSMIAQGADLDDDGKELLQQKQRDILRSMNLSPAQYEKAKNTLIYQSQGLLDSVKSNAAATVTNLAPGFIASLGTLDAGINLLNRDNKAAGKSNLAGSIVEAASKSDISTNSLVNRNNQSSNIRGYFGYMLDQFNDLGRANYDVDDIGDTDLPGLVEGSTVMDRVQGHIRSAKEAAINSRGKTTFLNNVNVDLSSKLGTEILSNIKANLPIGTEIQKDGNAQFKIDTSTGMVTITAPVKQGKEILPMDVQIPIANLPQQIADRVNLNQKEYLYSASNPNSVGYAGFTEIPTSRAEWYSQIEKMPIDQRTEAVNNPPKTQQDILKELEFTFGKEIVSKNRVEIQNILDRPVNFEMVPEQGQWTIVGKQGNEVIMRRPTTQEYIDPDLTDKLINKLGTEQILENVKLLLRNKQ